MTIEGQWRKFTDTLGMVGRLTRRIILTLSVGLPGILAAHADTAVLFREEFKSLDGWAPYFFPNISRHSVYNVQTHDGSTVLIATSDNSASALVSKQTFNIVNYSILSLPFTDKSIMIPLRHGPRQIGQWVSETVNLLDDYRRAFGEDPPSNASLAIMNDSDNTGESATAYIRFIEVRKAGS